MQQKKKKKRLQLLNATSFSLTCVRSSSAEEFDMAAEEDIISYCRRCLLSTSVKYQVPGKKFSVDPTGVYGAGIGKKKKKKIQCR